MTQSPPDLALKALADFWADMGLEEGVCAIEAGGGFFRIGPQAGACG